MTNKRKRRTECFRRLLVVLCSVLTLSVALAVNTSALDTDQPEVYQTAQPIQPTYFVSGSLYSGADLVANNAFSYNAGIYVPSVNFSDGYHGAHLEVYGEDVITTGITALTPLTTVDAVDITYLETFEEDPEEIPYSEPLYMTLYRHELGSNVFTGDAVTFGYGSYCTFNNFLYEAGADRFFFEVSNITWGDYTDISGIYSVSIKFVNLTESPTLHTFEWIPSSSTTFVTLDDILTGFYGDYDYSGNLLFVNSLSFVYLDAVGLTLADTVSYSTSVSTDLSMIERNASLVDELGEVETPFYTTLKDALSALAIDVYRGSFEMFTTDYVGWLGTAVGGFFSLELLPFISLGGILSIIIMIALVIAFLKVFMGG